MLLSGTVIAQGASIVASPVLTRLYSTRDYGAFALYMATVGVVVTVACARYNVAIMLADDDVEAVHLTVLALAIATGVFAVLAIAAAILHFSRVVPALFHPLGGWIMILPLSALLGSLFETLTYVSLRLDCVGRLARANATQSVAGSAAQLGFGFGHVGKGGLLGGSLAAMFIGNRSLFSVFSKQRRAVRLDWEKVWHLAKRYSDFPKYNLWSNLSNTAAVSVVVFGLGALYGTSVVGQYALSYRLLTIPAAIVGSAVGQVYFREGALRVGDVRAAKRAFDKTATRLIILSLPPFAAIALFGKLIFASLFGEEWREAGVYAAAVIPLIWVRFVASPVSSTYLIYERQRLLFGWQILLLGTQSLFIVLASVRGWNPQVLLRTSSLVLAAFYALFLLHARSLISRAILTK